MSSWRGAVKSFGSISSSTKQKCSGRLTRQTRIPQIKSIDSDGCAGFTQYIAVNTLIKSSCVFGRAQSRFEKNCRFLKRKSINNKYYGRLNMPATFLPSFSSLCLCLICPVCTTNVLKLNKLLSVKFSNCFKAF